PRAPGLGALGAGRAPRRGRRDRRRLARGRVVPRPVDPRVLRAVAGGAAPRRLARRRGRRRAGAFALPRRRDPAVGAAEAEPSYYALRPGGWRDYVTLLHPPYTAWHLSYVAVGAALAPRFHLDRLVWALAAFALAMGVAAHALDELNGRPLRTQIPGRALVAL